MKNTTSNQSVKNNVSKEELIAKITKQAQGTQAPSCASLCIG